jgi:magnesium chelatase family protein
MRSNAELSFGQFDRLAPLTPQAALLLERRLRGGSLSARGLHRVRRVARTIADLAGASAIDECHMAEALHLRSAHSVLFREEPS